MSFIIIKSVVRSNGIQVPVVLLDSNHEVLEYENQKDAEKMAKLLQANTDSGHTYTIKKVG
jgi:hypothetical protein